MKRHQSLYALSAAVLSWSLTSSTHAVIYDISDAADTPPATINTGDTLNLTGTGSTNYNFEAHGSSIINIDGGTLNAYSDTYDDSTINLNSGKIKHFFDAHDNSEINMSGGEITSSPEAFDNSTFNISGTAQLSSLSLYDNANLNFTGGTSYNIDMYGFASANVSGSADIGYFYAGYEYDGITSITGGSISDTLSVYYGNIHISGGSINRISADSNANIHFLGTNFTIDGNPIASLSEIPTIITDRDVILAGTLADGTTFSHALNSIDDFSNSYADASATITVALVPEPGSLALLTLSALTLITRKF